MASPSVLDPRRLDELLAPVSRSFYFSLRVLPKAVRELVSVAYLVARAADTIADATAIRAGRRHALLRELGEAIRRGGCAESLVTEIRSELLVATASPAEARLLAALDLCLATMDAWPAPDRERTAQVLSALIGGMERDLSRFPPLLPAAAPRPLANIEELEAHLYAAAGCVGEFWTRTLAAHVPSVAHLADPALIESGVHLGKALQMVNVIRDLASDLAVGRCYVPAPMLARHGLDAASLAQAPAERVRPLLDELRRIAIEHVDASWSWVHALPATEPRLRLAAVWPLWIALGSLERAASVQVPLAAAGPIKIKRKQLYALMAESLLVVGIDRLLDASHRRRRAPAAVRLGAPAAAHSMNPEPGAVGPKPAETTP